MLARYAAYIEFISVLCEAEVIRHLLSSPISNPCNTEVCGFSRCTAATAACQGESCGYSRRWRLASKHRYAMALRTSCARHWYNLDCHLSSTMPSSALSRETTVPGPRQPVTSLLCGSRKNSTRSPGLRFMACTAPRVRVLSATRSRSAACPWMIVPRDNSRRA